ncbi:MAG: hypothetical protein U9N31_04105, partial [Candidatus Marinimicrobia bacterium]|nr:hypothetical protein [Candidatus Neomarinimicrobiota bacterium]
VMQFTQSKILLFTAVVLFTGACREDPERHLKLGNWYAQKGLVDEAILEFREVTRLYPSNPRELTRTDVVVLTKAHNNLALMYTKKEWWNYALGEAEICFDLRPTKENHELVQLVKRRADLEGS